MTERQLNQTEVISNILNYLIKLNQNYKILTYKHKSYHQPRWYSIRRPL